MLGSNSACFFMSADFFKIHVFEKFFLEYLQYVKRLDPDQAQHNIGPELGPDCFKKLSAEDTLAGK